jgi:hypothetical protein
MTPERQPDERDVRVVAMTTALFEAGARKVRISWSRGGTMTVDVEAGEAKAARGEWRAK